MTITLNDGIGGAILDEWMFQAREGSNLAFAPYPAHWGQTAPDTALYVTLSAVIRSKVSLVYSDGDAF